MSRIVYLNERSFDAPVASESIGSHLFGILVELLRSIDRRSRGLAIVSHNPLTDLVIGTYPIEAWLGRDRERYRRLRGLQNRSPFDADYEAITQDLRGELEFSHEGQPVIGLGLAAWHQGLAVSVDRAPWQRVQLTLGQVVVVELPDGRVDLEEESVHCRNASDPRHIDHHADWIDTAPAPGPRTPDELWQNRHQWYPNIAFLPSVERQIRDRSIGDPAIPQIAAKLASLQGAMSQWKPGSGAPDWPIDVVPENEGRHKFCEFMDLDGAKRLFELHARFAPGQNRIHFRLDGPERRIIVAHIGPKLGI